MLVPAIVQHPLGNRRLAGVDMGDNADIAEVIEVDHEVRGLAGLIRVGVS
jgi:hypothetical protein